MRRTIRWRAPLAAVAVAAAVVSAALLRPAAPAHSDWSPPAHRGIDGALMLPVEAGSIRFAVMGDVGRGDARQYDTGHEMAQWHARFPFAFVLMLGDNIYGPGTPDDLALRFERPYRELIERHVVFHAVLGNHDPPSTLTYPPFGMNGRRYYSFAVSDEAPFGRFDAEFFALDSTNLDRPELGWLAGALERSRAAWKIAFYHHPLYTSGEYGWRAETTRWQLEPIFVAGGVDVGFSGHEHFYERVIPQHGIQYFTSGGGGALREGDLHPSAVIATGFDRDTHFMLIELTADAMYFQTISRTGETVDYGAVARDPADRVGPVLRK